MADIHGSPAAAAQNPQATSPGTAPVPYQGAMPSEPPQYGVSLDLTDAAAEVMSGIAPGNSVTESAAAHDLAAGTADAPYYPGSVSPVYTGGAADAGGRDDVAGTVAGAVASATARWHELEADIRPQGSVYGDLVMFPP